MNTLDEVTDLIQRLPEPEQRELVAWMTESLDNRWRVAETAPRYGATGDDRETFTVEEYLALEERSSDQYEYAAGQIYAMSAPLQRHKLIAGNLFAAVHAHLRGKPCRPYYEKTRVNIKAQGADYFYYPDLVVACGQTLDDEGQFVDEFRVVIEVMSRTTERIDRREKAFTYRELPSMEEIVLVSQKSALVTLYRRTDDWTPLVLASLEQALELKSIDLVLPLQRIYEGLP
ncbi:MAG: Uma2 family endonuclease [Gammaproteobacteria bacterium]|nr:Uma2 family endonuclease [Gammaproteobacteria bacterium]